DDTLADGIVSRQTVLATTDPNEPIKQDYGRAYRVDGYSAEELLDDPALRATLVASGNEGDLQESMLYKRNVVSGGIGLSQGDDGRRMRGEAGHVLRAHGLMGEDTSNDDAFERKGPELAQVGAGMGI